LIVVCASDAVASSDKVQAKAKRGVKSSFESIRNPGNFAKSKYHDVSD
jgi:hypothetical protein